MSATTINHNEVLNNIQNLQATEKQLHSELNSLPPNSNFQRQQNIINQISTISTQKLDRFKDLYSVNTVLQEDITRGNNDLASRIELAKLVEKQLNDSKERIKRSRNLNVNNLRLTEINHYFSNKYRAFYSIFTKIILVCVALVIVATLRRRYILSSKISNLLAAITVVVGLFFILPSIYDISNRNNLVFSEYDFPFDPHSDNNPQHAEDDEDYGISGNLVDRARDAKDNLFNSGDCLGPECCKAPGLTYDETQEVCVQDKSKKNSETFGNISGQSGSGGASLDAYSAPMIYTDTSGKYYSVNN